MGFLSSIFGSTPKVPKYNPVDIGQSQKTSIGENVTALPAAQSLATAATSFNQGQISSMLEKFSPGFAANTSQIGKNVSAELKGQIPTDVSEAVQSNAAARALTGGFGGSGMSGNLLAKDLGLTSLDMMGLGTSTAESWTSLVDKMFSPGMMDVSSMFISPSMQFAADTKNAENEWNAKWLQAQVSAQPDPVAAGLFKVVSGTAALEAYGGGSPFGGGGTSSGGIGGGIGGDAGSGGIGGDIGASQTSAIMNEFGGTGAAGLTGSPAAAAGL
jgi:hypothetical protein